MSLITRTGKGSKLTIAELDGNFTYLEQLAQGAGGLAGTQYILVTANGTPTENAAELQAAYNELKTLSPASNNPLTLIASPGKYEFPNASPFTLDTPYISLVSLTGGRDVTIYRTSSESGPVTNPNNIEVVTGKLLVRGVNASTDVWLFEGRRADLRPGAFYIATGLANLICDNCEGGSDSFGGTGTTNGTFTNCEGGSDSFGGTGTASGTFTNCTGGVNSFGSGGTGVASGRFTNCTGGDNSLGGAGGTASGTFTNCIGGATAFGGSGGTLTGKLYYCRLSAGAFQTVSGGGRTYYCVDGSGNTNNQ